MKKITYFFLLILSVFTFVQPSYAHRYFDPWRAQWCTPDPYLMLYPGWSPYNYGLCNPLRNIDPSGDTTYAYDQNHNLVPIDNSPDIISWGQQDPNYVSGNFTVLTLAQYTVIDPFMGHFHHMQPNYEIVKTANGARWYAPRPTLTLGIVNIPGGPEGIRIGGILIESVEDLAEAAGQLEPLSYGAKQGILNANLDEVFESLAQKYGATIEVKPNGARVFTSGDITVTRYTSSTDQSPSLMVNEGSQITKYRGQ